MEKASSCLLGSPQCLLLRWGLKSCRCCSLDACSYLLRLDSGEVCCDSAWEFQGKALVDSQADNQEEDMLDATAPMDGSMDDIVGGLDGLDSRLESKDRHQPLVQVDVFPVADCRVGVLLEGENLDRSVCKQAGRRSDTLESVLVDEVKGNTDPHKDRVCFLVDTCLVVDAGSLDDASEHKGHGLGSKDIPDSLDTVVGKKDMQDYEFGNHSDDSGFWSCLPFCLNRGPNPNHQ